MKKFLTFLGILLFSSFTLQAQVTTIVSENFNPNFNQSSSFTISNVAGATWDIDQSHFVSAPSAIVGKVPNTNGDSIVLTTPTYDFTNYSNVHLSFKHICKISPSDIARIEYKEGGVGSSWTPIPASSYLGSSYYSENGFNAASYPFWGGFDSLMTPQSWWWKYEAFDLSNEISYSEAQFRFIIKKGGVAGSQINYGWLIDDLIISADTQTIKPPTVTFSAPIFQDTVLFNGPFAINAKVKSNSTASLITPSLNYTATYNGTSTSGTISMNSVKGDSMWEGVIPQFPYGAMVNYSITGIDSFGYYNTINSFFFIKRGLQQDTITLGDISNSKNPVEHVPFYPQHQYGWSKTLYFANELSQTNAGGNITNIAYFTKEGFSTDSISIYMKATLGSTLNSNYVDPITDGATLVWSGRFIGPGNGDWADVLLQNSFALPANNNLIVYVINKNGNPSAGGLGTRFAWIAIDGKETNYAVAESQNKTFPTGRGENKLRPCTRIAITRFIPDSNSVAMLDIVSPKQGNFSAGQTTPISVIIKNRGIKNLNSCLIGYSINGVAQPEQQYTFDLIEDFNDTVTIGNFIPTVNGYDTIVAWVRMPNGIYDSLSTDDTLRSIVYGCSGFLSGTYNVGSNGEFATLTDALTTLSLCGQDGDIVFALESGVYNESWDFSDMQNNYKITIQSAAMHHDSVILQPSLEYGIQLKNTTNISVSHITIDAATNNKQKGVWITGDASDINISHCKIFVNPTTTDSRFVAIHKEVSKSGILNNCRISNNIIDGGCYGIYMYVVESGSSSSGIRGTLTIDSNTITNASNYSISTYYGNVNIHGNTILSRAAYIGTNWYGINSPYCLGAITCNKIQTKTLMTTAYGIYSQNIGDSANLFSIINNEVYLEGTSSVMGIYLSNATAANIIHNSVYIAGTGTTLRAMQLSISSGAIGAIKNNIFVAIGANGYPIYGTSLVQMNNFDIDYNCYYSPSYIGYAGGAKTNLNAWRQSVPTDIHCINVLPPYINITDNHKLSDYSGFDCPVYNNVSSDIEGNVRAFLSPMGANSKLLLSNDGTLLEILGWNSDSLAGTNTTIQAVVGNIGTNTISSMTIDWKFNGTNQPTYNYTGNLAIGQADTITLGTIAYRPLYNDLSVYISSLNNGIDDAHINDTLSLLDCFCPGALSGIQTVGPNSTFPSINEALTILNRCGAAGSITLALEDGQYVENITLDTINGMIDDETLNIHDTLTITSLSGNRDNVLIITDGNGDANVATLTIQRNNVVIKDLTITSQSLTAISYSYSKCVNLNTNCKNIAFDNCWLKGVNLPTTYTTHNYHVAFFSDRKVVENLRINNCHFSGGSDAIYFNANKASNVSVNNNTFDSTDNYGVYFSNTSFSSFDNNTIAQRISNTVQPVNYIGIYMTGCDANITNNCIKSIKTNAAIYLTNFNTSKNGIVANNEIYAVNGNGIYLSNSKGQILHNSILCSGNTATKALYVANGNTLTIKNNNLVTKSSVADYPIYITSANSVNNIVIDYNNYYSQRNTYIGYVGANISSMADLRTATKQDINSVAINPMFQNEFTNLMVTDNNGLECPTLTDVTLDKNGLNRGTTQTTMGAYHFEESNIDAAITSIVAPTNSIVINNTPTDVKIRLYNAGTTTLTEVTINWMINGVLQSPYTWAGSLNSKVLSGDITIGNFIPTTGNIEIVAFVTNANNTADQVSSNDTAYTTIYGCAASSTYTIGQSSNADFSTIDEALTALQNCGINSAVRLEIESGSHFKDVVFSQSIPGASTTNTITFTSQSGNAADVVLTNTVIGNINHLVFSKLTFEGVSNKYYNIQFVASCDDIEFSDCILYGDTNSANIAEATIPAISALCHQKGKGSLSNFRMYRNYIYGGNYSLYFHGSVAQNDDITLKDNIIAGGGSHSIYAYRTNLKMENNTISNRVSATNNEYRAIFSDTSNVDIINNTFNIETNNKTTIYAMQINGNNYFTNNCNIADNTINFNVKTATTTYGIYTNYNKVNIKNNTIALLNVESKSFYGLYHNNALSLNVENNVVDVVSSNNTETFYGIYTATCKNYSVINGNKIWMQDTTLKGRAINLSNFGTEATKMSVVSNNELSLIFNPTTKNNDVAGIYIMNSNVAIVNNSIRISGGSQYETQGIYQAGSLSETGYLVIKNNNIDMKTPTDYPIFISNARAIGTDRGQINIDYNNLVAPQYVGYVENKITSISDWQTFVSTDSNSVSIAPQYINSSQSLEVSNKDDYPCPTHQQLNTDILGNPRYGTTAMGAYSKALPSLDLALINIDCPTITNIGDAISPAIVLKNTGASAITSATINWAYNNVIQSPITWTGNLTSLDLDTLSLGNITTATAGTNTIKVWISLVNGVNADDAIENDTFDIVFITCDAMLSGTFTVGANGGDFASMEEVANSLINCGIGGNVIFEFLPGIHNGSLQLTEPINGSDKYTIMFTKANRNSSTPAILQPILNDAVVLKEQKNISFDSLTIDATNGFTAIKFTGTGASVSSNISITNCNIYARKYSTIPTNSQQQYRCIDKTSSTGNIKDLLIRNCFITGGNYYGIYITNSTQSNDYRRITIDSNIITGTYNGGINVTYFKGGAIDNNIISTTVESSGSWAGITCSYYNDAHIRNNKIHSFEKTLTGGNGISNSQGNLASYVVGDVDISNNEIILKTSGTTNGIYISSIYKTNILHNSIYLLATGNARGIYLATVTACSTNVVKNNNIVVTSTSNDATAIVISNANYAYALYFELDYNNYYVASGNICKIGNAVFNTIPAVQTQTQQDANSISVYPNFVDTSIDLSLGNSLGLICPRHPKVSRDINGAQREAMTTIGAYTMHVYAGVDLQLTQIVEPINNTNNLCSPSYSSVKYAITNVGGTDIDFARHPMLLTIRTTGANNATIDTLISSGTLNILETKIFEVTNALFTDFIGTYNLEASLNCASDTITENDTIFGVYQINKLNLPYDEDFSNSTFTELTIENLAGTAQWTVVSGNNNGYIDPFFGTGKLAFSGSKGTISRLSTGQIELNRTAQPVLEFWYAHDTSHADMNDQLSVTVTFDGGNSHHTLMALSRYDNSISAPTWTKYFIDLSPYVDSSCAIIVFEGISYGGNAQYLDRIAITSNTNIALTDALAIDVNACSLNNKTLSIEMTNQTGQAVDFSSDMTSIIVEISGSANQTLTLPLRSGIIEGLAVDTFAITNDFNFSPGTYNIKAYISPAVDKTLTDDTIYTSIIINPNLTITPKQVTGGTSMNNCLSIGTKVYQEVNIANNGNLNMDNIELTLNIYNISGVVIETINESITGTLAAGEDTNYSFLTAYTVPEDESFNVEIIVNPACNTTMKYSNSIVECVDLINVGISKFIEPANSNECSKINSQQKITVTVINETPNQDMRNISINAIIYANNQAVTTLKETIDNINASDSIDFTFSQSFVVPQANNYTIKVYIDKIDDTNDNDTLYITKCTDLGISESKVNSIGMSQNMPNPANDMAKVNYTIPNQGKVIFTIASVTGQILHTQEIEAKAGANSIEFNTANFADGIYFYTMDFNGHRLTKKMTIKK